MAKAKKTAKKKAAAGKSSKRTITIAGKFNGPVNNNVIVKVFRTPSLPNPFNFEKEFDSKFTEKIDGLEPGLLYHITFNGSTPTQFDLEISGDFSTPIPPITSTATGGFSRRFSAKTTK